MNCIDVSPVQKKIQLYLQQLEVDSLASNLDARCLYCVNIPKSQVHGHHVTNQKATAT